MIHLDLPSGATAELRDPDLIPRKQARIFRAALYAMSAPATADIDMSADQESQALAAGKAILSSANGLLTVEDLANAMVLAAVQEWSYGEVTEAVLDDVPDVDINAIYGRCQALGFDVKMMPDFGVSPDEGSPTTPS